VNRMDQLCDPGTFTAITDGLESRDPLGYPGYRDALARARARAGTDESVVYGPAEITGRRCVVAMFRFAFIGGTMGEVAGERVARAMEEAAAAGLPFVLWTQTGGARMQEGMRALVQMPKVVAARNELSSAHVPFVAVLGSPTTGGVLAAVAGLADVTFAVENATIGFAGPRIVQRMTGRGLSNRSHTAHSAFDRGLVDAIISEAHVRLEVGAALAVLAPDAPHPIAGPPAPRGTPVDAWDAVDAARRPERPKGPELMRAISEAAIVVRGDRSGNVDPALETAIARVAGRRCIVIATDARRLLGPAAFRTARRALGVATRLDLPVVTLVDTRGADPGEASEAGGIAWEIASTFEAMLSAPVPTLAVVTGEGGSGGALALAAADRIVLLEDAFFSVLAPEAAAEILWRDEARAAEAASLLRLTAPDLVDLGVADALLPAPLEPTRLRSAVAYHLDDLGAGAPDLDRPAARRKRWRRRGEP
jgi:acyl-CoA carboxylase subunit beta